MTELCPFNVHTPSVRPGRKFWPELEPDGYNQPEPEPDRNPTNPAGFVRILNGFDISGSQCRVFHSSSLEF